MSVRLCLCTVPDREVAERLARLWVTEKFAACVNILPGITSVYQWEGRVQQDSECLLLVKTTDEGAKVIEQTLAGQHPYECPEWVVLEGEAIEAYAQWVGDSVNL